VQKQITAVLIFNNKKIHALPLPEMLARAGGAWGKSHVCDSAGVT
jgi:hypothetical protein